MTHDQHPFAAVIEAAADISLPVAGTWYGWGAAAIEQWLQITALVATIAYTVIRIYFLCQRKDRP